MKPILFNTEMVRAILDGRKTQTRRVVKIDGWNILGLPEWAVDNKASREGVFFSVSNGKARTVRSAYPPANTGDILYVRETWAQPYNDGEYKYRADYKEHDIVPSGIQRNTVEVSANMVKWHPSIHLPKDAARIFLRVKDVRIEKLQEITDKDAEAEGAFAYTNMSKVMHILDFVKIWNSTIKPTDDVSYSWDANPYVWVISFERISKKEAVK